MSENDVTHLSVTRNLKILREVPVSLIGEKRRASISHVIQIAPGKAALFISSEVVGGKAIDYVGGTDAVVFGKLEDLSSYISFPVNHNNEQVNPITGRDCIIMKFAPALGFVPDGTLMSDHTPHPHAGTGFGLFYCQSIDNDMSEKDGFNGKWAEGSDVLRYWELLQFRYLDGKIEITGRKKFSPSEFLPGHTLLNRGLSSAIADGEDLLLPVQACGGVADTAKMCGFAEKSSGFMRWKFSGNAWIPVSYTDVTGTDGITAFEPSMIRDGDGALLFTARQTGRNIPDKFDVFLWRSADNGLKWELMFHKKKLRSESPVSLNMTPEGVPFIAGNLMTGGMNMESATYGYTRDILCLWELATDRRNLKTPIIARCASFEFGPPPTRFGWRIDHPISNLVELAGGEKYCIMSYRIMAVSETKSSMPPTSHTGCYIETVRVN